MTTPPIRATHSPLGRELLGDDEDRDRRHPGQVHHPADEEKSHHEAAAAEAEGAVAESHAKGAPPARPPVPHDEGHGRAAVLEAGVLERRPLIDAGGDEEDSTEDSAGGHHHRREQRRALQPPLHRRGSHAEPCPDRHVAEREERGGGKRPSGAPGAVHPGEDEDHGRCARHHHRHHHHRPHDPHEEAVAEAPRLHPRHGTAAGGHVAPHVEAHVDEVEPGERSRDDEAGQHHQPVAARDSLDHGRPVRALSRTSR